MDRKKSELSRREMLTAAAAASFGTALLSPAALAAQQAKVQEGKDPGVHEPIPELTFDLENSSGSWTGIRLGGAKCSVVSFADDLLRPSLAQADSKRRPIIQASGPDPVIRLPKVES